MKSFNGARALAAIAALFTLLALSSCGGGGGNPGACISGSTQECSRQSQGSSSDSALQPSDAYAGICTLDAERKFTRSYLDEVYLWYREVPNLNASAFSTIPDYFYSLLTPQKDSTGQYKDRFSFVVTDTDADSLLTGENVGYGVHWEKDEQGRTRLAYVDAGSPAANAGLARGGQLVNVTSANADWFPNTAGSITFDYRATPAAPVQSITLATAPVVEDPVPMSITATTTGGRKVGYVRFDAFTSGSQDEMIAALQAAKAAGIQDLVLDLRYNGGGYLYSAVSAASMIAGPAADGQIAEQLRFNDKRAADTAAATYQFSSQVQVGETAFPAGTALPRLNLPRVFVLATGDTCSASETVINSLRGVGVNVVLIGGTTCGKPYGFARKSNCGWSYFPIEFQGVNQQGFGDYTTGFAPTCALADDFDHPLGNSGERLFAAALYYIDHGSCPMQAQSAPLSSGKTLAQLLGRVRGRIVLPKP